MKLLNFTFISARALGEMRGAAQHANERVTYLEHQNGRLEEALRKSFAREKTLIAQNQRLIDDNSALGKICELRAALSPLRDRWAAPMAGFTERLEAVAGNCMISRYLRTSGGAWRRFAYANSYRRTLNAQENATGLLDLLEQLVIADAAGELTAELLGDILTEARQEVQQVYCPTSGVPAGVFSLMPENWKAETPASGHGFAVDRDAAERNGARLRSEKRAA